MLRVLHFINDLDEDGGAQRVVRDLVRLLGPDLRSTVLTLHPVASDVVSELESAGVDHLALRPGSLGRFRSAWRLVREAELIHVHLFPSLYLAALFPGPKLFTEHNTWNRRRGRQRLQVPERFVYRRYDAVVSISEATRHALVSWLGEAPPEACVIENGVRLDRFRSVPRANPQDPATLAMIARFTEQKDQATLLRAVSRRPSLRLLLVGDGPLRGSVEALVHELGLEGRVELRGRVPGEEIPGLLAEVDLYVQSSRWEGFGLGAVEAMASGVPTLGTRVPGLTEVVADPSLLFEPGDVDGLVSAIDAALDPPRYAALSRRALERARAFSAERMAEAYGDLYRRLAGRAR